MLWTAPWKDDVERITGTVEQRITQARDTLGVLDAATGGDCAPVGRAAPGGVSSAAATIAREAEAHPAARVRGTIGGVKDPTVRQVAAAQATLIGDCIARVPRTGAGWRDLQRRLRAAAG